MAYRVFMEDYELYPAYPKWLIDSYRSLETRSYKEYEEHYGAKLICDERDVVTCVEFTSHEDAIAFMFRWM